MPLDDDASDPEAEEIAYHEAGHATAAVLCVAGRTQMQGTVDPDQGTEFFNGMNNGWTAYVAEHYDRHHRGEPCVHRVGGLVG